MTKVKEPKAMNEPQWAEYIYDRQAMIMTGIRATVEIIDGNIQRGHPHVDMLLEDRKKLQLQMIDYSKSNEQLLDIMPVRTPILSSDFSFVDENGNLHRIVITPGLRERVYNRLNKFLRSILLNGQ
jgi:hypothetical protein